MGFVAGGGVEVNLGRVGFAPQVRYTRWFTAPVFGIDGGIYGGSFSSNLNQIDVLVGIRYRLR